MARLIDLPEVGRDGERREPREPRPFNMPRETEHHPAATGCAVLLMAWVVVMAVLAAVALTGGLARLAFWAMGA